MGTRGECHTLTMLAAALALVAAPIHAQEEQATGRHLELSPELLELLRAEMRSLATGIQSIPLAIATADWKTVSTTSAQIGASYILAQKLSAAQKAELQNRLPEHFKRLDADFHREAGKLQAAAERRDTQLTTFHYYRLLETCTACHSLYAPARFPDFGPATTHPHTH